MKITLTDIMVFLIAFLILFSISLGMKNNLPEECPKCVSTIYQTECPEIIIPEVDCVAEVEKIVKDLNNIKGLIEE